MKFLKTRNNYDVNLSELYYDFLKDHAKRKEDHITTIDIKDSLLPEIIKICDEFEKINHKSKRLFIISNKDNYLLFDKLNYKINYQTIKKCDESGIVRCKYINDLNTTRFKKSQTTKFPTTKDIIEYQWGQNYFKYYLNEKNFIIVGGFLNAKVF